MTRHIISKQLKNNLFSDSTNIPYLIGICLFIFVIGIGRAFIPINWLMYLYNFLTIMYMINYICLILLKKQLKPNQSLLTYIGFQMLLCIASGWWLSLTIWVIITILVLFLMIKYDKSDVN